MRCGAPNKMRTLESWRKQEERLRAEHARLCSEGKWLQAQSVRTKLIMVLDKIAELSTEADRLLPEAKIQANESDYDRVVEKLKRVIDVWKHEDPEWVENGCADLSFGLWQISLRLGWPVRPVTGIAVHSDGTPFEHAWLAIDGKVFDPSAYASGYKVKVYKPRRESETEAARTFAAIFGVETNDLYGFDADAEISRLGLK